VKAGKKNASLKTDKVCYSNIASYFLLYLSEIHIYILLARYMDKKLWNYENKSKIYGFPIFIENFFNVNWKNDIDL